MFSQNRFKMFNSISHTVKSQMFATVIWIKFKIIWRIIGSISIFMLDNFPFFQWTTKNLRHYKTMLIDFSSFISHRMMEAKKYFYISMFCRFPFKRFVSMFFLPRSLKKTSLTKANPFFGFQFSQNHIMTPPTNFSTLSANSFNKEAGLPRNIFFPYFTIYIDTKSIFRNNLFFHINIIPHLNEQINKVFQGGMV